MAGAVLAGVLAALQGRVNGALAVSLDGDAVMTAALSTSMGLVLLAVVLALRAPSRDALLRTLPRQVRAGRLRWWQLIGGFASAFFVVTQGASIPALGVAVFTVLVVAGTTGSSLVFDAIGLTPGGRRRITAPRVIGAVGTTLAVVVAVSGRFSAGSLALAAVIVTISAGVISTFQMAINGMVAEQTDDGLVPVVLNLALGIVVLLVALPVAHAITGAGWEAPPAPWQQPLLWLGGPLGVGFLLLSAIVIRPLGVLLYSLVTIGGQLAGAVALDVVAPTAGAEIGWQVVLGVLLTGAAVVVAALPSRRPSPQPTAASS
ncbi:MAG: DMT family transporter [Candidatus Nanopelagicales bacterium]